MSDDRCVSCGEVIPEGRQVCFGCEHGLKTYEEKIMATIETWKNYDKWDDDPEWRIEQERLVKMNVAYLEGLLRQVKGERA
jgi:hypothetical protein